MAQTNSGASIHDVREQTWAALRRYMLPLLLALTLFILTFIPASQLDSRADACIAQVQEEKEQLRQQFADIPAEERTQEQEDLISEAYVREGQLKADASEYRLYAKLLRCAGLLMCSAAVTINVRRAKQ